MGLDMFLYSGTGIKTVDEGDGYPYKDVENREEVAYWRKFNALHNWMVQNVQGGVDDCGCYEVTNEHLDKLHATVDRVIANPQTAPTEFPTTSGFFFGTTEYGNWFWEDMEATRKKLRGLDRNKRYWYHSSW